MYFNYHHFCRHSRSFSTLNSTFFIRTRHLGPPVWWGRRSGRVGLEITCQYSVAIWTHKAGFQLLRRNRALTPTYRGPVVTLQKVCLYYRGVNWIGPTEVGPVHGR